MPGNPLTDPNWAADFADTVERVVGNVRDKTTVRAVKATRGVVFGLLAGLLGLVALVLFLITATRVIQDLLDIGLSRSRSVYLSYFIVGGILSLAGMLMLKKRFTETD